MKAVVYDEYGPPEVLRVEDQARPSPKEGEVLIRIRAVEVTKADCEMRRLDFPVQWFTLPLRLFLGWRKPRKRVLGFYFAGEVVELGANASRLSVGEEVWGCGQFRMAANAEYAVYPESYTIGPMPKRISFAQAASSLLGGLNALHFLNLGKVEKGDRVLINGGGGSIGLFAIQMAKAREAWVCAVDKAEKESVIRQAGADRFIDYQQRSFLEEGNRYDVVFNMVPSASFNRCIEILDQGGRYLLGNPKLSDMLRAVFRPLGKGRKAYFGFASESRQDLDSLGSLIEEGGVTPIVDRTFRLEQAAEAHRLVESEQRCGGIALCPWPDAKELGGDGNT